MDDSARRVTFPPLPWVLLAVFGLLMLGSLVTQVVLINRQRELLTRQTRLAEASRVSSRPVLAGARPLVSRLRAQLPALAAGARDTSALARDLRPLVRSTQPLVDALRVNDAPRAIGDVAALARGLSRGDRLVSLTDRASALIRELERTRAVPETLRLQRELLAVQLRAFRLLQQSLAVQRESLTHIRSLDAKTGGGPPLRVP